MATQNKLFKMKPQEYRELLKKLKLIDIFLINCKCTLNPDIHKMDLSTLGPLNIKQKTKQPQSEGNIIKLNHIYQLNIVDPESKEKLIDFHVEYTVTFQINFKFNSEFFEIYSEVTLPINTYPFFREFIYSTISKMGLPPLTLPLLIQ